MQKLLSLVLVGGMLLLSRPCLAQEEEAPPHGGLVTVAAAGAITVGVISTSVDVVTLFRRDKRRPWAEIGAIGSGVLLGAMLTGASLQRGEFGYPYPQGMAFSAVMVGAGVGAWVVPKQGEVALRLAVGPTAGADLGVGLHARW